MNFIRKSNCARVFLYAEDLSADPERRIAPVLATLLEQPDARVELELSGIADLEPAAVRAVLVVANGLRQAEKQVSIRCTPAISELFEFFGIADRFALEVI